MVGKRERLVKNFQSSSLIGREQSMRSKYSIQTLSHINYWWYPYSSARSAGYSNLGIPIFALVTQQGAIVPHPDMCITWDSCCLVQRTGTVVCICNTHEARITTASWHAHWLSWAQAVAWSGRTRPNFFLCIPRGIFIKLFLKVSGGGSVIIFWVTLLLFQGLKLEEMYYLVEKLAKVDENRTYSKTEC